MAPSTRKRKSDQDITADPAVQAEAEGKSKRQKQLPVRAKDGSSSPVALKAQATGTMMVFDDDDDDNDKTHQPVLSTSTRRTPGKVTVEEEVEDSDDDAPEAVSTQQAASQVKKSAHTAQKAAQEQAAEKKRKRQERDTLFKQQAEERKKVEAEAKAQAVAEPSLHEDSDAAPTTKQSEPTSGRRRMDKIHVPNVLPAEFLTDSSSEDEEEEIATSGTRPKKRHISSIDRKLSRQDKAPRDARIGSTVYRVAKTADERLAPKAKKYGQSSRDLLLKRNRSAAKSRSGFF